MQDLNQKPLSNIYNFENFIASESADPEINFDQVDFYCTNEQSEVWVFEIEIWLKPGQRRIYSYKNEFARDKNYLDFLNKYLAYSAQQQAQKKS